MVLFVYLLFFPSLLLPKYVEKDSLMCLMVVKLLALVFSRAVKGGMMGFLESGLFQDLGLMLLALAFILCSSCL